MAILPLNNIMGNTVERRVSSELDPMSKIISDGIIARPVSIRSKGSIVLSIAIRYRIKVNSRTKCELDQISCKHIRFSTNENAVIGIGLTFIIGDRVRRSHHTDTPTIAPFHQVSINEIVSP